MVILAQTAPEATQAVNAIQTAFLMSVAKPLLAFIPLVAFAWVAATKFDRDARYYQIDPQRWGAIFLAAAGVGALAVPLIPIFWVGWPVEILILGGTAFAYVAIRNPKVPEKDRWNIGALKLGESMEARKAAAAMKAAAVRFLDGRKQERPVPLKDDPLFPVHQAAEQLIGPALEARASRLELTPTQQGFVATQTVDGVRFKGSPMPPDLATAVIDYVKGVAGADPTERRKRQTGDFYVLSGDTTMKTSLTVHGGSTGQSLRLDFDRERQLSRPFDSLGLLESQAKALAPFADPLERRGVILVTAVAGQGLTTAAYSLLSRHDAFTCNVKSLEKQIDLRMDGVDQQVWNASNPTVDYATALQSITRRGPDIVLVGEIAEPRAGQIVSAPGSADILFYVPIQVATAPGAEIGAAVTEWFRAVGDLKAGSQPLRAVVAVRLMRKLCEVCRVPHPRAAELAKKLGMPPASASSLLAAGGKVQVKNRVENCALCRGSGFMGQVGAFEVVVFNDEARQFLAAGDWKSAYAAARRATKLPTLQEAGLLRVRDGTTSIEEFQRVMNPPKPPAAGGAASASAPKGATA